MFVWRVQNKEGEGPYAGLGDPLLWSKESHCKENGHPGPHDDEIYSQHMRRYKARLPTHPYMFDDFKYGFITAKQLRKWFSKEELKKLRKLGYRPQKVRARYTIASHFQCAFIPY